MRAIIAFTAIAIVAVAGVSAFQAAQVNAGQDIVVENETFDPATSPITVEEADSTGVYLNDPADETVRNSSDVIMDEGSDYRYHPENGTLVVLSDGRLANDSTGYITYGYQQSSSEQRGLASLLAGQMEVVAGLVFVGIVLLLLATIKGVA
ncbi:hypothetical protein [Halobacterium hubeiense]|uniref:hypothetical protein n=1 Tax=Halobacterium hubeiense TaxID=1407499 RepID=UPI003C7640FC